MIAFPSGARVWLATGHTDMRKGFGSLAVLVQEEFKRDPHAGDLWVFRGKRGDLIKLIWHDGDGACLFTRRLERGRFLWPSVADGVVTISAAVPSRHVLELADASSGDMRLSDHAARSMI
jgi:transposase